MRRIKSYITILFILLAAIACEKEGDNIILKGHESSELSVSEQAVTLSPETDEDTVLTITFNTSRLSLSDESMGVADDVPVITIEISENPDFTSITEIRPDGESHEFSGARLNSIAKNAGLEPGTASPLYFRIQSSTGANQEPLYSNVASVDVTPYEIDMSKLFLVDTEMNDTLAVIDATETVGEYSGFVYATSWMNFFFVEGDGTIWGNNHVSGVAFEMTTDEGRWNCWFPANGGSYYITMNTNDKEWSATRLPYIAVGGDLTDTLSYYSDENMWAKVLEPINAGANIMLKSDAMLYNTTTGDSDENAIANTLYFKESGADSLTFANTESPITLPNTGTQTFKLFLTGQSPWNYITEDGNTLPGEQEEVPFLYLPGSKDGETGGDWTFDNYLTQINDNLYAGVHYINSNWGFQMFTKPEWGADYYTAGETEGTLEKNGEGNIPAPEIGTYFIKADTLNMTYSLLPMGDVVYISGLNDNWDFTTTLSETEEGVYSGTIEVTTQSSDGFRIYRESGNWDEYWGGTDGNLVFEGDNITEDTQTGTYTLTVDFINETYEMTLN